MSTLAELRAATLRLLTPPPRQRLSAWIEAHVNLPEGTSATPGPVRLWPYQREIADAIGDPTIERVTLQKSVRVGFTCLLTSAIAAYVANDPAPVLYLLPTESDARDFIVSDVEPMFEATPIVAGTLASDARGMAGARNTLLHRRFVGGSLKVVASKAPRNLRRHTARVLFVDEADAMVTTPEGSPILLAERRTLSFADRKIVVGSTPGLEETSHVVRCYATSDQRVYEVPCPACATFTEILWRHIEWEAERPETAGFRCPQCQALIGEAQKPAMVAAGRWRATKPEVIGHAGFKLNALVSALANATWGKLAAEFVRVKDDSDELQVFVNTLLAEPWKDAADDIDDAALASRAEPFDLEAIPDEVLFLTAGIDVQDDRLEVTIVGWSVDTAFVLGHVMLWGSPGDDATWKELDGLLGTTWRHPGGGALKIDACIVDSGDSTASVYAYAFPRARRRIWAGKGIAGSRPVCELSRRVRGAGRLMLVGVDTVKSMILDRCARGRALRFSHTLPPAWYEQLASERRVVRYVRGQPTRRFERKPGMAAEALDCLVYAFAAKHVLGIAVATRTAELSVPTAPPAPVTRVTSPFVDAW